MNQLKLLKLYINFKNGKAKAIKIETLNKICKTLNCQPGDILEWRECDEDK